MPLKSCLPEQLCFRCRSSKHQPLPPARHHSVQSSLFTFYELFPQHLPLGERWGLASSAPSVGFKPLTSLYSSLFFPFLCQDTWHKRPLGHHPCSQNQAEMPDTAIEKPINAPFGKPPTHTWHSPQPIPGTGFPESRCCTFSSFTMGLLTALIREA